MLRGLGKRENMAGAGGVVLFWRVRGREAGRRSGYEEDTGRSPKTPFALRCASLSERVLSLLRAPMLPKKKKFVNSRHSCAFRKMSRALK